MKKLFILILIVFCDDFKAQLNTIIDNMFFNLPLHSDIFTLRTKAHSTSNFHSIDSDKNYLSGDFYLHPYISEMPIYSVTPHFRVQFENDESFVRSFSVYYNSKQINECLTEYNSLIKILTPYFKKIDPDAMYDYDTKEKIGTGKKFYGSKADNFYTIAVLYTYRENKQQYELQVIMWEKNVWSEKN